ncbi:T-cell immunoglobulin and mucin domain-containing protein 4-like [Morone saxatilis]|uniref:T-cell immunoglobulin and mucin domain-containing protein 4-like n=1 Tax=Morone saxatilis TaxID=34816 RepID=UPI0015E1C3A6|nr:T-cell immunoglobulin and mucin domain-containing protein 4-like [Morone saxatilis]
MKTQSSFNWMLLLLTVSECSSSAVVGRRGHNVTLNCRYNIKNNGALSVCWNRGEIPLSGCNNKLISTDGRTVRTTTFSRFQLLGRLDEGDVSLTILNLTESDSGRYGCRVDIPGWFNDAKHHFDLTVERAPLTTSSTPSSSSSSSSSTKETSTKQTANNTTGQLTSTQTLPTSSSSSVQPEGGSVVTVVLVCVLFGLIALVTAGAIVIIARRWKQINKIPQQQVHSTVQFSSTSSSLELHRRSVVENIYNIDADGGGDGGEYEYCP